MMNKEERVAALHAKMEARTRTKERQKTGVIGACSVALSICLLLGLFSGVIANPAETSGMYSGAMMLFEGVGGYALVAIAAFTAAVIITVYCMRRPKKK